MAFRNPPIAGSYLVRPAIQSPNYVLGSAGWTINRDGTAEFNGGTFRGSITVGSPAGQHFIVNNSSTSDVIDVYDSSNRLVLKIDDTGALVAYDQPAQDFVSVSGAAIQFTSGGGSPPNMPANIIGTSSSSSSSLQLDSGLSVSGFGDSAITPVDSAFAGANGRSDIKVYQRGTPTGIGITGSLVQTDAFGFGSNVVHAGLYSGTVAGGAGLVTFNHGCNFTPVGGVVCALTNFSQWNWHDGFGAHGFTSTQAQIMPFFPGGASLGNGQVITFYAWFWG